ncbi:hypothetical protein YC2023_007560 [Brassica napus]
MKRYFQIQELPWLSPKLQDAASPTLFANISQINLRLRVLFQILRFLLSLSTPSANTFPRDLGHCSPFQESSYKDSPAQILGKTMFPETSFIAMTKKEEEEEACGDMKNPQSSSHQNLKLCKCSSSYSERARRLSVTRNEGIVVGLERDTDPDEFALVKVHGVHDPLRVHVSVLERVTNGLASGDWVRLKEGEDKRHSLVGVIHSIDRDGNVAVGFIRLPTLWKGSSSQLQMAKGYSVGQFVKIKANVVIPRFKWMRKGRGIWATGRISKVLPNGCLEVEFPGVLPFGEEHGSSCLADPAEAEIVDFNTCEGVVKKYQHLEDFHWAVRPLLIAMGLLTAMKLGLFVGKKAGRSKDGK